MLATVLTAALVGLDGHLVEVQVDIAQQGVPNFFRVASGQVGELPRQALFLGELVSHLRGEVALAPLGQPPPQPPPALGPVADWLTRQLSTDRCLNTPLPRRRSAPWVTPGWAVGGMPRPTWPCCWRGDLQRP